jgi:glycosyltransferase involved in cell wall biosynthesis
MLGNRSGKKPKVMHLGYNYNPSEVGRGGVVVYQWAVMKAVERSGWDVTFFMGAKHTLLNRTRTRTYHHDGIKIIELINSPRRHLDFSCDPLDHLNNQVIDEVAERILDEERPDLVHIHDPRLFTVSVVDIIKKRNIPVIKTIHNYFDLCPQGELLFRGKTICLDYHEGSSCRECLSSLPEESFMKERISNTLRGTFIHPALKKTWRLLKHARGGSNVHKTEPLSFPSDSYKRRREYCIERLQMLDTVHCYSRRSAEILVSHGVSEKKIFLIPISSDSIEKIKSRPVRQGTYPVVFGYLTGESYLKGYEVIMDAFSGLDQNKAKLIAYGFDKPENFRSRYRHLNVEFHKAYHPDNLNKILSSIDVGLVPSIWEEVFGIVGIEFLSAGIPVIGSDVGGIPEWLVDGESGFLVRMADSGDLHNKMERFINDPGLIRSFQKNIKPWKTLEEHTGEILNLYHRLL